MILLCLNAINADVCWLKGIDHIYTISPGHKPRLFSLLWKCKTNLSNYAVKNLFFKCMPIFFPPSGPELLPSLENGWTEKLFINVFGIV